MQLNSIHKRGIPGPTRRLVIILVLTFLRLGSSLRTSLRNVDNNKIQNIMFGKDPTHSFLRKGYIGDRYSSLPETELLQVAEDSHMNIKKSHINNSSFTTTKTTSEIEKVKAENRELKLQVENADLKRKIAEFSNMRFSRIKDSFPTQMDVGNSPTYNPKPTLDTGGVMPIEIFRPNPSTSSPTINNDTAQQRILGMQQEINNLQKEIEKQQFGQEQPMQFKEIRFNSNPVNNSPDNIQPIMTNKMRFLRSGSSLNEQNVWEPTKNPDSPYLQALGQANMAATGLGYHPMNSRFNPLYGPGNGAATPQAISTDRPIRGTMLTTSQYPNYYPTAGNEIQKEGVLPYRFVQNKSPQPTELRYGVASTIRRQPIPAAVPPRPGMGPAPPPISRVFNTPDVLPQPIPPTSPHEARSYVTQYDAGVNIPPGLSVASSRNVNMPKPGSLGVYYPGEAPFQESLSRSSTMRLDQQPLRI